MYNNAGSVSFLDSFDGFQMALPGGLISLLISNPMDEVMDEVSEGGKGGDKLELSETVKVNGEMNGACDESMEVSDTFSKSPEGDNAGNEDEPADDDSAAEDAAEEEKSAVPNNNDESDGVDEHMEVDSDAKEVPNQECDTSSSEVPHTSNDKSEDNLEESLNNGPSAQSSSNVKSAVDEDKLDESDAKDDEEEEFEDKVGCEPDEDGGDFVSEQSGEVSDKKVDNETSEKDSNCEQNVGNSESETDRTLQNGGAATPDGSEDPKSSEKGDEAAEETTPEKDDSNANKEEEAGDGEETTPTKKGKGKKKVEPAAVTLTPRRSSRNLNKQKSYVEDKDDLPERDDGSDIEEITMVDPLAVSSDLTRENKENSKARNSRGGPNKTIVVNDTKHLVEIASGSKSVKGVKKEPTLVIIDTNSILSGRGPIPAQQQHTLHKAPQRSQLQITPAHPIHSTTITQSYSVLPVSSHQQPTHSSATTISPRLSTTSTITPVKPPIILPSLTDDMYVVEAPSFIVPYVYEKPPVKSLKDFIETLQENIKAAKEAEKNRKEEAEKSKKEEAEKSKKEEEEKSKKEEEEKNKKEEEEKNKKEEEEKRKKKEEEKNRKEDEEKSKEEEEKNKMEEEEDRDENKAKKADESKEAGAAIEELQEKKETDSQKKSEAVAEKSEESKELAADKDEKEKKDGEGKDKEEADQDEVATKTSENDEKMEVDEESKKEKEDAVGKDSEDITEDSKKDVKDKEKTDEETTVEKDGDKEDQVNGKVEKDGSKKEEDAEEKNESSSKAEKREEDIKEDGGKDSKDAKQEESKDKKPSAEDKEEETAKDLKVHPSEKNDGKTDSEAKDLSKSEESKKPTSYFENPLGKFFIQIGINLVQEHVQTDLLRSQKKKREREGGKGGVTTQMAISSLEQTLEFSKENNEPFHLKQKKCDFCNFKTESALVMAHHMETPHMRNYVYRCNFCPNECRSPHDILFHMEAEHNVRGRLERGPAFHQCPSCSFEDNQKGKLTRHLVSCQKRYRPEKNQEPPLDWEPPAKIPRVSRNRPGFPMAGASPGIAGIPGVTKTPPMMGQPHPLLPKLGSGTTLMGQTTLGAVGTIGRGRGRPPMQGRFVPDMKQAQVIQQQVPRPMSAQTLRQGMLYRSSPTGPQSQVLLPTSYHIGNQIYQVVGGQLVGGMPVAMPSQGGLMPNVAASSLQNAAGKVQSKVQQQPSISITPLPRQPTVTPPNAHSASMTGIKPGHPSGGKATFVICEICDGYIKDLEQLRSHMQWIHKVKIHPKMIFNRPPLNCQKCQFRFFTDQGLERHLLGSHGLVTSSMQEAANKGKDGGRCPVCGRVYQWKLLNHVARDHSMTLKPAHLSYKCTVCTATFGMYKQFENHVYTAHSVVAKRVMEKKPGAGGGGSGGGGSSGGGSSSQGAAGRPVTGQRPVAASPQGESLLKPLKINDEITIIPQPARARPGATGRPSPSPAHVQTKGGAEERERPSRSKDGAEVIDLEGAAGKDALSAVQERLRRRTSLEVSQVEPEQPPNKKSRKD